MNYALLSLDELLRIAHLEMDSITTTPLEAELLRRLEEADASRMRDLEQYLDDTDRDDADALALLKLCDERGAESPKALTDKLDRADRWYDLANEAGDVFARLEALRLQTT